jgi:3-dehydroquinate dehydratase-2
LRWLVCQQNRTDKKVKLLVLNGPNLNLQGRREKSVYGAESFEEFIPRLRALYAAHTIDYAQSNIEGELIDALHKAEGEYDGVLFNAGGYTHTSVALRDAIGAVAVPVIEIHISNVAAREDFRHTSLIGATCVGTIAGFGLDSYRLGIEAFLNR